jgi:threonine dehydratase
LRIVGHDAVIPAFAQRATLALRDNAMSLPVSIADIRAAAAAIDGAVLRSPMRLSRTLSQITGAAVHLKFENRQFTASFKERGALNTLLSLTPEERGRGVVAMSAGNHAQGVAYHAGRLGIPATIVMPVTTPFNKIKHTSDFGATVLVEGADLIEATAVARGIESGDGRVFIHPYDDPRVIAGQGTVGLEMLEEFPGLDALIVPVGGGGLIAGVAIAAMALKPGIEIHGVQSELYPAMREALHGAAPARHPTARAVAPQTMAEGIAVKSPGAITVPIVKALVRDILIAREEAIEHALALILEIEKTLVEGAAAAALAALLAHPARFAGRRVGLVMSGGNIDMRLLSNLILRELVREDRILSLTVELEDRPGQLALVAALVGGAGGNILEVAHNRMMDGTPLKSARLGLVIEARDAAHAGEIRAALQGGGFKLA